MSGNPNIGAAETVGNVDLASLMGANPADSARNAKYEATAGGFEPPGNEGEPSGEPAVQPQPTAPEPQEQEIFLGGPPKEEPAAEEPEPEEAAEPERSPVDYDSVIDGLTTAARREREARQKVQESLEAKERELAEAKAFVERYSPHIDELAELWPDIQRREQELYSEKQQKAILDQKLKLYQDAVREAGLEVDDRGIDERYERQQLMQAVQSLPTLIDQRLAAALDTRAQQHATLTQQQALEQAQSQAKAERLQAAARVLDSLYEKHPDLKDFDKWIRPDIEADPLTDPATVAAPFMKVVATKAVKAKVGNKDQVRVAGSNVSQTAPADANQGRDLGKEFAGMSLDEQFAKMKRMGMIR